MEVLGAVGSSIAVAQVLVAGRHIVNLVRGIPEIQKEYDSLRQEINLIADFVGEAQRLAALSPTEANYPSRVQESLLSRTAQQLKDIEDELAIVVAECGGESKDKSTQARKRKWLLREGKIDKLRDKARDAKTNLHNAILFHHQTAMSNREQRRDEFESRIMHQLESFSIAISRQLAAVNPRTTQEHPASPPTSAGPTENIDDRQATPPPKQQRNLTLRATSWETKHLAEYKTIVPMGRPGCSKSCRCRCHFIRQQRQNANWFQPLLGAWCVTYKAIHDSSTLPCTDSNCKPDSNTVVEFEYRFPAWFWTGLSAFKASYSSLTGLDYALRPGTGLGYNDSIWAAVRYSTEGVFHLICNQGIKYFPNEVRDDNMGLLEYAMMYGMFETLEFFLNLWIALLRKQGIPETAMFKANWILRWENTSITGRERGILRRVVELADDVDLRSTRLCEAIIRSDEIEDIEQLLHDEPWAINTLDETGHPPLCLAARMGRADIAEMLIENGADVNLSTYEGTSPIMLAASYDMTQILSLLLKAKADVTIRDWKDQTALNRAVAMGSAETVSMLLAAGACTQTRDMRGATPLHYLAMRSRNYDEVDGILQALLVARDIDLEAKDVNDETTLYHALLVDNLEVLTSLVQVQASTHFVNKYSWNILHVAACHCRLETLRYLAGLKLSGVDHQLVDIWGFTPWDRFEGTICGSDLDLILAEKRRPTYEEQEAFVELYQGIRDRNLQNDISRLQRVLEALSKHDRTAASSLVGLMSQEKTEWKDFKLASWYRGVGKEVQVGDVDVAIRMIESDIACLEQEMSTLLWYPEPDYDAWNLEEEDDESSESAEGTEYDEDHEDHGGNCTDDEGLLNDPIVNI
ncbi:hypothetical protein FDECE_7664 [Fusarium decemcellulare]|nr:hypothetical protein FDECE_7664 [Fusarium decemcellulare]